ncbi:hypothetical protein H9623_01130 [Oerskovia sp. Sa1BUA8]|uniref:Uncharacterized protein n=1 Tax=Oerskovia douganii TaxID=2762210 RepID=A0A9D5U714_9CELL|nr:hypothetical protein [Oerskovia douganii]MBE7698909.1 hypothetical protein [Oerskovia douganii]
MIVRAVALPGTPLLVPGVAGSAEVLAEPRSQALDALRDLARYAHRVVVLDCGARRPDDRRGTARPGLEAVGVAPRWWGWTPRPVEPDLPVAGVATSVALLALDAAGWEGPVEVVELGTGTVPAAAVGLVRDVLAEEGTGLVVVTGGRPPVPDGGARPADAGAAGAAEHAVLDALGAVWHRDARQATGEYEGRVYEVVRFRAPAVVVRDSRPARAAGRAARPGTPDRATLRTPRREVSGG